MNPITLNFLAKTSQGGLYVSNTDSTIFYFLQTSAPSSEDAVSLTDAWNNLKGAFIFLTEQTKVESPSTFISNVIEVLNSMGDGNTPRWIAWIKDQNNVRGSLEKSQNLIAADKGSTVGEYVINDTNGGRIVFDNLRLGVPQGTVIRLAEKDGAAIRFSNADFPLQLGWNENPDNSTSIPTFVDNGLQVPLSGSQLGVCLFSILVDQGTFYQLFADTTRTADASPSAEMRYTFGTGESVSTLRFPIFQGILASRSTVQKKNFFLNVAIDPIEPTNSNRSIFVFDPKESDPDKVFTVPITDYFNDTFGHQLQLTPQTGAGFSLGLRPSKALTAKEALYLIPSGKFQVVPDPSGPQRGSNTPQIIKVLCGINGTEFLLIAEGDFINFRTLPSLSHAPNFSAAKTEAGPNIDLLDNGSTTAWVSVVPGPNQETVFTGIAFKESYCVQAEGGVFFHEIPDQFYATAIGCRIGDLSIAPDGPLFPMVPYGGIYDSDIENGFQNPNATVTGSLFEQFELDVISPNRRKNIPPDLCLGPLFFDLNSKTLNPLTGFVLTPQGLLVELNNGKKTTQPAGSWNNLILAKSPINEGQFLTIGYSEPSAECVAKKQNFEVVNPYLSTSIMANAPFIVITEDQFGKQSNGSPAFQSEIQMGEFTFWLDLLRNATAASDNQTIIIFKLDPRRSVEELSQATSLWNHADFFVGNQTAVANISKQIQTTIAEAKKGNQELFGDFVRMMTDPNWTGVFALNCSLKYEALPIDLKMILGGIDGTLMAHHFGVTLNRINFENPANTTFPIDNSSLFGLIHHEETLKEINDGKNHFQVLKLNALFRNSVQVHFDSRIAMTIPKLFEEIADLTKGNSATTPGVNVIEINGVYQKPSNPKEKVGRVIFNTDEEFVFAFPANPGVLRVLDKLVVTDAALMPVNEVNDVVTAHFGLQGGLGFIPSVGSDPNNGNTPVDLFSFAVSDDFSQKGLSVSDYNFEMETTIKGNTATLNPNIPTEYSELRIALPSLTDNNEVRTGSLYATFPFKFNDFELQLTSGLTAADLSGRQMTGLALEDASPNFAIRFRINVGSLGALVSDNSILEAEVLLGWTIGGSKSQANKVGMIFIPPNGISVDGSFKIEGVFNSFYGDIILDRYPKSLNSPDLLFVITLDKVNFNILSLPLIPFNYKRGLTLFGDPSNPNDNNLAWFVGNPSHEENPTDPSNQELDITFIYKPFMGLMSALEIENSSNLEINVIGSTINKLLQEPIGIKKFINNITTGESNFLNYNPKSKILFWLSLDFASISLNAIFNDPSFYGGQIKVTGGGGGGENGEEGEGGEGEGGGEAAGAAAAAFFVPEAAEEGGEDGGGGEGGGGGLIDVLNGLDLIFVYRKINDHLGVYAGEFTLPEKLRSFNVKEVAVSLPSFGLEYFTNGDFKFTVGWPFSSTASFVPGAEQFSITVPIEGVPVTISAGFYFAKLRSEDSPEEFGTEFALIYMFGIGLAVGIGATQKFGPLTLSASIKAWGTFEGMLASKKGDITNNGVDYYWFAGQCGITANITGKVSVSILKASLEIEATLVLQTAFETGHRTDIRAAVQIKIELKVSALFITVSFRFKADVTLAEVKFGNADCPAASITAPDVTNACNGSEVQPEAFLERAVLATVAPPSTPVDITLYFTLQPTAVQTASNNSFKPYAVASLFIEYVPEATTGNDFTNLVRTLMPHLVTTYGGQGTFSSQLNAILSQLGTIEGATVSNFEKWFNFTIQPGSNLKGKSPMPSVAVFAMIPGLEMVYNNQTIDFNQEQASSDYLQTVEAYFNSLAAEETQNTLLANAATVPVTQIVFENYFGILIRSTVESMLTMVNNGEVSNLTDALNKFDYDNLAGMVSRYSQHGLQLPVPGQADTTKALYALTNQEVEVAFNDKTPVTLFELEKGSQAPSWVTVAVTGEDKALKESLDPSLIFQNASVSANWSSSQSIGQMDALQSFTRLFKFPSSISWTTGQQSTFNLRPFGDALNRLLVSNDANMLGENNSILETLVLKELTSSSTGVSSVDDLKTVDAAAALFIPVSLRQIAVADDQPGQFLKNVYQLVGTDENTRRLLGALLTQFSSSISGIDLLTSTGRSNYKTEAGYAKARLVRANLSTDAIPDAATFSALFSNDGCNPNVGPVQAELTLADASNFLWLVWECSVLHTSGFFLQIDNLDAKLFNNGVARVAFLAQLGQASSTVSLGKSPHFNALLAGSGAQDKALGAFLQYSGANKEKLPVYRANYLPGYTGFKTSSTTLANPTASNPEDYLTAIYHFVQYRINSISGDNVKLLSKNWSVPLGARADDATSTETMTTWLFRQNIPVPKFINNANRYSSIGRKLDLSVRVLDMFGNTLPNPSNISLNVLYNDPLISPDEWKGVGLYYQILPVNNVPHLALQFFYSPNNIKNSANQTGNDSIQSQLHQTIDKYELVSDQLTDPNGVTATVLSPLIKGGSTSIDFNNEALATQLNTFVQQILTYLKSTDTSAKPPTTFTVKIQLNKADIKDLPGDITKLNVDLKISRDPAKVDTSISNLYEEVLAVQKVIPPFIQEQNQNGDSEKTNIVPFAQKLEAAYQDWAGPNTWLKLAQGPKQESATGKSIRELYVVRWGKDVGINVTFQNNSSPTPAQQPTYFSPPPLSTLLLNGTFDHLYVYDNPSTGKPSSQTSRTFNNVDLDAWAEYFLSQTSDLFSAELSTAISTLSPNQYKCLVVAKENLATAIQGKLTHVLNVPNVTPNPAAARQVFEQALLASLGEDYGTSSVIQLPAEVMVNHLSQADTPNLFGKISPNLGTDDPAEQIYTLSSARLAAKADTEDLAFLLSAKRPEMDAFLDFEQLFFNIGFIELQDEDKSAEAFHGIKPSTWLTFVLPGGTPLQVPMGAVNAPIPLRDFPSLPVLFSQIQVPPAQPPSNIVDSLQWSYQLTLGKPVAEQDELFFTLMFSELLSDNSPQPLAANLANMDRPAPENLFEALARFTFEYPMLSTQLDAIVKAANSGGNVSDAQAVIQQIISLVEDTANVWPDWTNPGLDQIEGGILGKIATQTYAYSLINKISQKELLVKRMSDDAPWPGIAGYTAGKISGNQRTYTLDGTASNQLQLTFADLFILTHQSVQVEAYVVRNGDLAEQAPEGTATNNAFVYTTQTVKFPTPLVPINQNTAPITLDNAGTVAKTLANLFNNFVVNPNNSSETIDTLRFNLHADTKFTIAKNEKSQSDNLVEVTSPILFSGQAVATPSNSSGDPSLKLDDYVNKFLAPAIVNWQSQIDPSDAQQMVFLELTIFSNVSSGQLPLVVYSELDLPT